MKNDYRADREIRKRLLGGEKEKRYGVADVALLSVVILLVCLSFVRSFWLAPVKISGLSMNATIEDGDWLLTDKLKEVERGDVVVVKIDGATNYIKRVVAMPGDSIKIVDEKVYVKEKGQDDFLLLDEPYAYFCGDKSASITDYAERELNDNEFFFLGDNRRNSYDCRKMGPMSIDRVVGVVPNWAIKIKGTTTAYFDVVEGIRDTVRNYLNIRNKLTRR